MTAQNAERQSTGYRKRPPSRTDRKACMRIVFRREWKRLEELVERGLRAARLTASDLECYRRALRRVEVLAAFDDVASQRFARVVCRATRKELERRANQRDGPVGTGPGRPDLLRTVQPTATGRP